MAEETDISWTHHTWNPWSGCSKVSPGCANCYAANLPPAMRRHAVWGPNEPRVEASESYWMDPIRWHRSAVKAGEFRRVFCGSVMDIGEDRDDLIPLRDRALALVALTQPLRKPGQPVGGLHWLWLTKRPEVLARYFADPGLYRRVLDAARWFRERDPRLTSIAISDPGRDLAAWYPHLAVGTSVENQEAADERIPHLLRVPARVRFLSCEPLLGPVDLEKLWCHCCETDEHVRYNPGAQPWCIECDSEVGPASWLDPCADERQAGINWVIVGGESGRKARPMHPDWARTLRDQCVGAGVACVTWDEFPAVPT